MDEPRVGVCRDDRHPEEIDTASLVPLEIDSQTVLLQQNGASRELRIQPRPPELFQWALTLRVLEGGAFQELGVESGAAVSVET